MLDRWANSPGPSNPPALNLANRWDEFTTLYFGESARVAQQWIEDHGNAALTAIRVQQQGGPPTQEASAIIERVREILMRRHRMTWPGFRKGKGKENTGGGILRRAELNVTRIETEIDSLEQGFKEMAIVS